MTGSRETFNAKFQQERAAIRALADSCDVARRGECVLGWGWKRIGLPA